MAYKQPYNSPNLKIGKENATEEEIIEVEEKNKESRKRKWNINNQRTYEK